MQETRREPMRACSNTRKDNTKTPKDSTPRDCAALTRAAVQQRQMSLRIRKELGTPLGDSIRNQVDDPK